MEKDTANLKTLKELVDVVVHNADEKENDDLGDDFDISVDLIDDHLYLGNLRCARDSKMLEKLGVTHVLTLDVVPLPRVTLENTNVQFKYVKLADVPKEDLISHLPETTEYIKNAISNGGTVLVHCYFGVSRSAAVVIAYIMEKYKLCYNDAFTLVKDKRTFVQPNVGFVAQLKLYGHMGYGINKEDPRYKQFRLRFAGQKLSSVKILPQIFADLVKPDPGLIQERPDPIVYRCKKCRRIVASQKNIIPHIPKPLQVQMARRSVRSIPSHLTQLKDNEKGKVLCEKLQSLAGEIDKLLVSVDNGEAASSSEATEPSYDESLIDMNIAARVDAAEVCRQMWFVEPMAWMKNINHETQGKLNCPKCQNKIGSFSWIMGCKCPCGQKVAPAFYLVPSKVEWSNIVQNVQITI